MTVSVPLLCSEGTWRSSDRQLPVPQRQSGLVDVRGRTHGRDVGDEATEAASGARSEDDSKEHHQCSGAVHRQSTGV